MTTKTKPRAETAAADPTSPSPSTKAPRPDSKIGKVIALLQRKQGATLAELTKTTGWQVHSVRAALTGLKKKEYEITKSKRDGVTCYSIAAAS